jgi:RNA polymerase sigma-70 factor (ECF subfamily)
LPASGATGTGPNTDAALVARARDGDRQAFERLVVRHRSRAYEIARQITHDAEAAQDATQEALLQAFRSLPSLRNGERFGQWLNTIVRRQAQRLARDGRHRAEPLDEAALLGSPVGMWVATGGKPSEMLDLIRDSVAVLTQRERSIVVLHYLHGYSCEEVAAKLGIATGSVKRILHTSRRKVRKEVRAMTVSERKGPRRLSFWISGSVSPGHSNIFDHMRPVLAQTVCLSASKEPKTLQQVADEVGADIEYVRDAVDDLEEMTALTSTGRGQYLTSFIALEAEDWRAFVRLVPEPAAKAAQQFAASTDRLRTVWEKTALARSGWSWEKAIWVIYAVQLTNTAMCRALRHVYDAPAPARPGGGSHWMAGREVAPGVPSVWSVGLNSHGSSANLETGYFWTWGIRREDKEVALVSQWDERDPLLHALADGITREEELVALVPRGAERARAALADLVRLRMVARDSGGYRLNIPFFTETDSEVLTPEFDAVARPIVQAIYQPVLEGLGSWLDERGYGRHKDQYHAWRYWLASNISGEALRFLMEQGVLPRPADPAPGDFAHLAWKPGIELMRWR